MKFCQIVDNRVYWVFEADVTPIFASNIIINNITNIIPQPQEGWDYDSTTNTYTEHVAPPIIPQPPTDAELIASLTKQLDITQASAQQTSTDLQGLMDYLIPE